MSCITMNLIEKLEQYIDEEDISQKRTAEEFIFWFETKLAVTKQKRMELDEQNLLHQGIAKIFFEELFPLYRLLQSKVTDWRGEKFKPVIGNQNYDVEVQTDRKDVPRYIEITTTAINEDEHNRIESFLENGSVDMLGQVSIQRKPERKIHVENGFVCGDQVNQVQKDRITNAIERKLKVVDRNPHTALLVHFDDYTYFRFDEQRSKREMDNFLETLPMSWAGQYESLYIVGASGKSLWVRTSGFVTKVN